MKKIIFISVLITMCASTFAFTLSVEARDIFGREINAPIFHSGQFTGKITPAEIREYLPGDYMLQKQGVLFLPLIITVHPGGEDRRISFLGIPIPTAAASPHPSKEAEAGKGEKNEVF